MNINQLRFTDILQTIDSITFHKLDERVLYCLEEKSEVHGDHDLKLTHKEIADDLNSSREVVSSV